MTKGTKDTIGPEIGAQRPGKRPSAATCDTASVRGRNDLTCGQSDHKLKTENKIAAEHGGDRKSKGQNDPLIDRHEQSCHFDNSARTRRLVEQNLGLAIFMARRFTAPGWVDRDDFESASLLALFKAATVFDPGRNVSFAAFAGRVIRNGLIHALKVQRRRRLVLVNFEEDKR